jgi:N-acetylmuramoyl-L-alanine amidase
LKSLLRRRVWSGLAVLAAFSAIAATPANASARHSDSWAREHFAAAERLREALNGRPSADRTRRDYQRVLNAYRVVYRGAPTSAKADPSVVAVAETLVEMGHRFDDNKILHEAIGEYKFLRREYPGSKYRFEALFTIGEIYQDDLNDPQSARAAFQEFLHRYPHNRLAGDARDAIAALEKPASQKTSGTRKLADNKTAAKVGNETDSDAESGNSKNAKNELPENDESANKDESVENESLPAPAGHLPRVTSIRHWSTPDYTRVAIDLESDVKFSSQRIANPARIYFDLPETRLASTLVGKTFDVDDGFLKKVRVAQFAPRRTRIVLEVDNLSDYDAFLLPNPSRLIIDIHGKNFRARQQKQGEATEDESASLGKVASNSENNSNDEDNDNDDTAEKTPVPSDDGASTGTARPAVAVRTPVSSPPLSAGKPQTNTVVKRIVEADDDDEESVPVTTTKPKVRALPSAAPDKREPLNLASDSEELESSTTETNHDDSDGPRHANSAQVPGSPKPVASDLDIRVASPTIAGERSLIRALGLKIGKIVIDAGHGGHDTGTIGPNGLEEKDLVLDVGRRLGRLLETRLGAEVVYTRKDDTFIPLETRTAIANQARADLFVSIHANSSHDPAARGVETYYLNFTSSPDALEVAARENAVSEASIYELQDLVKKIALKEKIEESREFAWDVQESLHSSLAAKAPAIRDRGVKKAPFIVLIGANMPSILAEISFVSNPTDEHRLSTGEYRERIAESLYHGIAKYVNGLSGVKVASKFEKTSGQ